jgi:hypothetical protein
MTYAGVPFQNSIEGGGNIIIPFLQSPNFSPGVSGWRISRNGDAEFASQTLRGPLIVTNPLTGLVVASISSTGNIAGQFASIENDIILAGQSLADRLLDGRGLVALKSFNNGVTPVAPGTFPTFTNTAWFRAPIKTDRVYYITCTPLTVITTAITAGLQTRWVYTDSNGGSGTFATVTMGVAGNSTFTPAADSFLPQGFLFSIGPAPDTTATLQLQAMQSSNNITFDNVGGWNLLCYDVGSFANAMIDGNLGTSGGQSQKTTQFPATLSQSYNGSGNQFVSTDLWRSDFGDGKGMTTSLCIFDGAAIRAALAPVGTTIQSATLTMFCTTAEESNGSIAFDPNPQVSIPGTQASFSGGTYAFSDDWPNPGWFTVNIHPGSGDPFLQDIINGDNAMKISAAFTGGAATRFAGASVANRPYITVTYTN